MELSDLIFEAVNSEEDETIIIELMSEYYIVYPTLIKEYSPLIHALKSSKRSDIVSLFINITTDINTECNLYGKTALFYAVENTNIDENIIEELINKGADVNYRCKQGMTPLMFAVKCDRNFEIIRMLIDAGSNTTAKCKKGKTVLHYALDNEDCVEEIIRYLLSKGLDVNDTCSEGLNPLMYAVRCNKNPDIAIMLIDAGASMNVKCKNGKTVLHYALENIDCSKSTIRKLISEGLDLDHISNIGLTPLLHAISCQADPEIINILIDAGCNVNAVTKPGFSVLTCSIVNYYDKNFIIDLINKGVDLNQSSETGFTPLMYAILQYENDPEIPKILIMAGANLLLRDKYGRNVLMFFSSKNCDGDDDCKHKEFIDLCLSRGIDLHETDNNGNSLLHHVNCKYIIQLAVKKGVSINVKNNVGDTPLMLACVNDDVQKVKNLLFFKPDLNLSYLDFLNMPICGIFSPEVTNLLVYHGGDLIAKFILNKCLIFDFVTESYIKNALLFTDENELNDLNCPLPIKYTDFDGEIYFYCSFLPNCKAELSKMRSTFIKDGLSFYDFCILKKLYRAIFIDISYHEYKYNYNQIKDLFPIFKDLIIMRVEDNHYEKCKKILLKCLENIIIKPLNESDSPTPLLYDCLYIICSYLNNNQIYNLFHASIES